MLAIILLTLLSLFTPVFAFNKGSISTALSNAVPALIVLLVLIVLASPFAYFTVHRLRLEVDRTHRKLRHSKATVESLSHRYIIRTNSSKSPQKQTNNPILKEQLDVSLATIEELKFSITTMAAAQARTADDARNFKDMLDEAVQQKLVFERRAEVAVDLAKAQAKKAETALDKVYELECRLEARDAELYDVRSRARKVDSLEGSVEDLKEENKVLRHLICEYQVVAGKRVHITQELEKNKVQATRSEASSITIHDLHTVTVKNDLDVQNTQTIREEVSTSNNTLPATSVTFATNGIKHTDSPAQSTAGRNYSAPIHVTPSAYTMADTHAQSSTKTPEILDFDIADFGQTSPICTTPSLISDSDHYGSSDSGYDSESTVFSPVPRTPSLVSYDGKSNINDSHCTSYSDSDTLTPEPTFTFFPSPTITVNSSASTDHTLLMTAKHQYWKTIWAMKSASIKGEA